MRKLISLVLAIAMLVSLVPTHAFATEADPQTSNIITLFDFGDTATFSAADYSKKAAAPSAFCYDGKSSSLRWEMDITSSAEGYVSNTPELDMKYNEVDLSAYSDAATINVRFYSENAGSKFNLVYYGSEGIGWKDTNDDGESDMLVSYNEAVEINGGWQVHSVSLKTIMDRFRNYADDKLITVRFNDDGWDNLSKNGYNDGDTVYIDEIWVDTNPDAYYESLGGNTKLLWEATGNSEDLKSSVDLERNLYKEYTISNSNHVFAALNDNAVFSDGDYQYVNMWIYSEKAQNDGMYFTLEGSFAKSDSTTTGSVIRFPIQKLDWTGWKLVSFNIEKDRVSADSGLSGKVIKLRFDVGKWNNLTAVNKAAGSVTFGLDGVWLSNTSAQEEWENANTSGNIEAIANSVFSKDFNTSGTITSYSTDISQYQTTRSFNAILNRYNGHTYDTNARLSFTSVTWANVRDYSSYLAVGRVGTLQIKDRIAKNGTSTQVNSNSYINAWIYNPTPKYTFDGTTPAEMILAVGHRGTNNASNVSYKYIAIPANWSGWKLISIPVSFINADLITYGIAHIYLSCNLEKLPRNTDGNVLIVERSTSDYERGYMNAGTYHNVFARKYSTLEKTDNIITNAADEVNANYYNYIDVERVWISDGPVTDEVSINPIDNSGLLCPEAQTGNISLFTDNDSIAKIDVNTIKSTADGVSVASASLANGALTLTDGLDYGTNYSVCAEIIGTNGVKTVKEFTFNTENYHVKNTTTANSISVEMYGNVPEDYAKGIMVAAVYEDNTMVSCTPVPVEDRKVSVQIDNFDSAKRTIKFIFINGWSEIKPLKAEIIG